MGLAAVHTTLAGSCNWSFSWILPAPAHLGAVTASAGEKMLASTERSFTWENKIDCPCRLTSSDCDLSKFWLRGKGFASFLDVTVMCSFVFTLLFDGVHVVLCSVAPFPSHCTVLKFAFHVSLEPVQWFGSCPLDQPVTSSQSCVKAWCELVMSFAQWDIEELRTYMFLGILHWSLALSYMGEFLLFSLAALALLHLEKSHTTKSKWTGWKYNCWSYRRAANGFCPRGCRCSPRDLISVHG